MTLFGSPDKYFLVSGCAEGESPLNAFDNALNIAGIGNTNLIRLSSILPPSAALVDPIKLPFGSLVPIAYASIESEIPGSLISASVACGLPEDASLPGIIMEHHSTGAEKECLQAAIDKVEAAFRFRKWRLADIKTVVTGCEVRNIASAFAGVVLWK